MVLYYRRPLRCLIETTTYPLHCCYRTSDLSSRTTVRIIRLMTALALATVTAAAIWRLVIPRYRCSRDKQTVVIALERLDARGTGYTATVEARLLTDLCRRCLERFPNDHEMHLLLGSAQLLMGDRSGAATSYRRSIALNERPETYAYLAVTQLQNGQSDAARENLYYAAAFNVSVVLLVADPLRSDVERAVFTRHENLIRGNLAVERRPTGPARN